MLSAFSLLFLLAFSRPTTISVWYRSWQATLVTVAFFQTRNIFPKVHMPFLSLLQSWLDISFCFCFIAQMITSMYACVCLLAKNTPAPVCTSTFFVHAAIFPSLFSCLSPSKFSRARIMNPHTFVDQWAYSAVTIMCIRSISPETELLERRQFDEQCTVVIPGRFWNSPVLDFLLKYHSQQACAVSYIQVLRVRIAKF